jgi:hypothetical protein
MMNSHSPAGQNPQSAIQLNDIHLPEQVSNFPIAPGWWILLILIVVTALWSYKKFKRNKHLNANKEKALAVLANNKALSPKECIALLKWAAMQYFSRQQLAKLYGDSLQEFLIMQLPEKYQPSFKELSNAAFADQYKAEENKTIESQAKSENNIASDCQQATKLWLTHALPINKAVS